MCPSDGKLGLTGESGGEENLRKGNKGSNLVSNSFEIGSYRYNFQDFLANMGN